MSTKSLEELLQGISVDVPAGAVLPGVMVGDTVRVHASIDYRGPDLSDTFYAAIGHHIPFFDEIWFGTEPVFFAETIDWESYEMTADILITEIGLAPWTPGFFDLYVKLRDHPEAGMPEVRGAIEILLRSEFRDFVVTSYELI